ncbi:serine hydrolase domain-containing protein [Maricaulis sp.]|uniref:serine hydrolase domain-containing protein n=1 Tax=Maricaulis sp. TaxID=1486257 RepID=UPI003A908A4B
MMFSNFPAARLLGVVVSLSLTACSGLAPAPDFVDEPETRAAQSLIEPWKSDIAPGVAVAVAMEGEPVWMDAAGLANLEHAVPIAPDTVFQVASVAKQFTAFAVLLLASEGAISLDDDIRDYIPELFEPPQPVTVRHLLDHAGGLREQHTLTTMAGWLDDDIRTRDQVMALNARQRGVNFPAGSEIEYSNTGYTLLAELVARISGMSFDEFTRTRMFEPIGMTATRFDGDRNALIRGRATSYYPSRDSFAPIIAAGETIGSTGLHTNAPDLLAWGRNFETRDVGNAFVFDQMAERNHADNGDAAIFGRGQERRIHNGLETWSHGGRDAGYRSFLLRVPAHGFTLVILSNRTDFDTADLAFDLVDLFLGDRPEYRLPASPDWTPATRAELDQYVGHYEVYPGIIFTISANDDGLGFAQYGAPGGETTILPQIGPHEFRLSATPDLALVFEAPQNAQSPGLRYRIGLHGTIPGRRIELDPFDPASMNLADYAGVYESAELATRYVLNVQNGVLVADHARRPSFSLTPYQTDSFLGLSGPLQAIAFTRDASGAVTGMTASASLAENVRFERVTP